MRFPMKSIRRFFSLLCALAACPAAFSQITIDEVEAQPQKVTFQDRLRQTDVEVDYFSAARYRAERAAIRKERNYLEISGGLQGALTSYNDPWIKVSGGDNSIALMATFFLRHTFTKNLFSIETKVSAKFGYNRMKVEMKNDADETESRGIWFKNQDELVLSVAPSFKMSENWSYGSIINFRSQFVNGYVSRTQQEPTDRKSTFLSPGYFDVSLGITYKCPRKEIPLSINISPIALSAVFVESALVRENTWDNKPGWQAYGLAGPDKTAKYEGGSSVQIDFDRTFGKSGFLRYRTSLYSFSGWITDIGLENKIRDYSDYLHHLDEYNNWKEEMGERPAKPNLPVHPTVRWTNTIDIKATKYLSTTLSFELYYNRAQNVDVQTRTLLSVGLTYTFKNK